MGTMLKIRAISIDFCIFETQIQKQTIRWRKHFPNLKIRQKVSIYKQ